MNTHYALITFTGDYDNNHPDEALRGTSPNVEQIAVGPEDFCWDALIKWTATHPLQRGQEAEVVARDPIVVEQGALAAAAYLAALKGDTA